jgi:hypothetical protein
MRKRLLGLVMVLLAAWGSGCSSAPAPEAAPEWSAIKFVPEESPESQESQKSPEAHAPARSVSR